MATVKETGIDDIGLLEFYQDYFHSYPIYKDEKWQLYRALGGRTMNMFGLLKAMIPAMKRLKTKKIESSKANHKNTKTAWMTGGVLVFDKAGELVYILEEKVGKEFDMEQIKLAIQEARFRNAAANSTNATTSSTTNKSSSVTTTSSSVTSG